MLSLAVWTSRPPGELTPWPGGPCAVSSSVLGVNGTEDLSSAFTGPGRPTAAQPSIPVAPCGWPTGLLCEDPR
jgi:hypothetical protein